jgi:hypothetical protein
MSAEDHCGHEVYRDPVLSEECEEEVFRCLTCRKTLIYARSGDGGLCLKKKLPVDTPPEELSEYLTFIIPHEVIEIGKEDPYAVG